MSSLKFDGSQHTITIFDSTRNPAGSWAAFNNIDRKFAGAHFHSMIHLKNGVYAIDRLDRLAPHHHHADPNGPYGSFGIIRFDYPGHPGVGVHSGRANATHAPGAEHPTHGCIRTTDAAMQAIRDVMKKDPLTTITIVGNSDASVRVGNLRSGHGHSHQRGNGQA